MANKALNRLGQKLKERLLQELILQDHNAVGELAGSIKYDVDGNNLRVYAKKYALVVNQGRSSGSYVPIAPITKWLIAKGIASPEQARRIAFAVSKSIQKRGTRVNYNGKSKRGFIDKALNKAKVDISREYGKHFREQVQMKIKRLISGSGKTIDIQL